MLSALKKSSNKFSALTVPAWHPNFRNFEKLPDIKVVRTTFFINGGAILIVVALMIYAVYREVELSALKSDTVAAKSVVDANKAGSDQAIILYKKFQVEERKIQDLQKFLANSKVTVSELILNLGSNVPPSVALTSVDCRPTGVTLRGGVNATAEEGAGIAVAYVEDLKKNGYFSDLFGSIKLTNIIRDTGTAQIRFEIDLKFKVPAGGKK
jgi:hypothetical protein